MEDLKAVLSKAALLKGFVARLILVWTSLLLIVIVANVGSDFDLSYGAEQILGGVVMSVVMLHVAIELSAWAIKTLGKSDSQD